MPPWRAELGGQDKGPIQVVAEMVVQASEVFTPNDFPAWTYVERRQDFDRQVFLGLKTPNGACIRSARYEPHL